MSFRIFKDTLSPSLAWTLTESGVPVDLTDATVKLRMRPSGSATLTVDGTAAVESPATAGNVRYDWSAGDTATAGDYLAWFHVTLPSTVTIDSPEFPVEVVAHGEAASWLVTVEEVREALEIPGSDPSRDRLIESLIPGASEALCSGVFPRFAPRETATEHAFEWTPGTRLDLFPYLCSSITSVEVEGEAVTEPDFTALPYTTTDGVYTRIRFAKGYAPADGTYCGKHGVHRVTITGDWGMPTIPPIVKRAACVTVGSWMAAEMAAVSYGDLDEPRLMQPAGPRAHAIPNAAWHLLAHYTRPGFA